jgi:hypothetical protein
MVSKDRRRLLVTPCPVATLTDGTVQSNQRRKVRPQRKNPNYHYLALCACQLIETYVGDFLGVGARGYKEMSSVFPDQ